MTNNIATPNLSIKIFFLFVLCSLTSIGATANENNQEPNFTDEALALSEFETFLPNTSIQHLPKREKRLLRHYLDHPNNAKAAKALAYYHFKKSKKQHRSKGAKLKHTILSQYFFQRTKTLGHKTPKIKKVIRHNKKRLKEYHWSRYNLSSYEQRDAHKFYRETFHYNEENRHIALRKLLNDFTVDPGNVYTSFAITAINLWIGGEADYNDPTMLYNFVLGSYFSRNTIQIARRIEENWLTNPETSLPLFRVSSILGGFSLLQRRWLARLHQDENAIAAIDDEHREWRLVNRAFHAFTFGIPFFEEPENFQEGLFALFDGLAHCDEDPTVRTCLNRPRFSYNILGYILILIDFNLKSGDFETVSQLLQYRFAPHEQANWTAWDLGQEAWLQRENNVFDIMALYLNDDPNDDPLHFQMKRKKWGDNTTTCQTCHQVQGHNWTEEEFNNVLPPAQSTSIVGQWPEFSTTWWAKVKKIKRSQYSND